MVGGRLCRRYFSNEGLYKEAEGAEFQTFSHIFELSIQAASLAQPGLHAAISSNLLHQIRYALQLGE